MGSRHRQREKMGGAWFAKDPATGSVTTDLDGPLEYQLKGEGGAASSIRATLVNDVVTATFIVRESILGCQFFWWLGGAWTTKPLVSVTRGLGTKHRVDLITLRVSIIPRAA